MPKDEDSLNQISLCLYLSPSSQLLYLTFCTQRAHCWKEGMVGDRAQGRATRKTSFIIILQLKSLESDLLVYPFLDGSYFPFLKKFLKCYTQSLIHPLKWFLLASVFTCLAVVQPTRVIRMVMVVFLSKHFYWKAFEPRHLAGGSLVYLAELPYLTA